MSERVLLDNLWYEVSVAAEAYERMRNHTQVARREESEALNRLNEKQAAFDAEVNARKNLAPCDSSWKYAPGVAEG